MLAVFIILTTLRFSFTAILLDNDTVKIYNVLNNSVTINKIFGVML